METTHAQDEAARLTVSEAARISGMSADTIRRYANSGRLKSFRTPSGHRRFRASDVDALLTVSETQADGARGGDAA